MPELPEVEIVKQGLAAACEGAAIAAVDVRRNDLRIPVPADLPSRITGQRIEMLTRRAKYILFHLSGNDTVIVHLGMSGRFTVLAARGEVRNLAAFYFKHPADEDACGPHDHVVIELDNGTRLVYTDPRRFGLIDRAPAGGAGNHRLLSGIGIEPLGNGLNATGLAKAWHGKKSNLKAALLNQKTIAGLGNIYVCEALHRAGLSPERRAGTLARGGKRADARLTGLVRAVRDVLTEAIAAGGSTLRDFAAADGSAGGFQQRFQVYDRAGQPCPRAQCTGTIQRIVQSNRSTYFCAQCQR